MILCGEELSALGIELGASRFQAIALDFLGLARWAKGSVDESATLLAAALPLYDEAGDLFYGALCWTEYGRSLVDAGHYPEAREVLSEAVRRARELGQSAALGFALDALALFELGHGDRKRAAGLIDEAVAHYRTSGYQEGVASGLNTRAATALAVGDCDAATTDFREAIALCRRLGHVGGAATSLDGLARVAERGNDIARAVECASAAEHLRSQSDIALPPHEQQARDEFVAGLRAAVAGPVFEDAWAKGARASLDVVSRLAGLPVSGGVAA